MASHAKSESTTCVRITLDLPAALYDAYSAQAARTALLLDEFLVARLEKCLAHNDSRPLYLSDIEREEVEQLLGGGVFAKPADLLRALRTSYTVSIGGAQIKLDPQVYTLLKDRSQETNTPLRDLVLQICNNALGDYALGGH